MMTAKKVSGVALAAAAAAMFAVAPMSASAGSHKASVGKCHGSNSCKGTSACQTATTNCAGQNSCKGQGWVKMTKAQCDEKGGKFEG